MISRIGAGTVQGTLGSAGVFTAVVAVGATGVVAMPYSVYASAAATFVGQGHPLDPSFRS